MGTFIDPLPGTSIYQVAKAMVMVSAVSGEVVAVFNGVVLRAFPRDTEQTIVTRYYGANSEKALKP